MSDLPQFDLPFPLRLSRREFMASGAMLPWVRMPPRSANRIIERNEAGILGGGGSGELAEPAFRSYPGALVGFWCAPEEKKAGERAEPQQSWEFEIPSGWLQATITSAFDLGGKGRDFDVASVEVLLDGKPVGRLQPLTTHGSSSIAVGWHSLGYITQGIHRFALAFKSDAELKIAGAWLTNGLLSFWPGNPMVLSCDQNFWQDKLRMVPRPVEADLPLEFGAQGLASHINQQGMIGIADSRMTGVGSSMRLRYSDAELNVLLETADGPRRAKDLCPDFHLELLDGFLPCPVARFTHDHVRYAVTFAAIPEEGEAVDLVHVTARNEGSEPRPNNVVILLDAAADVAVEGSKVFASKECIAYCGETCRAQRVTRPIGYIDPRAQPEGVFLAPYLNRNQTGEGWQSKSEEWDPSLYSARRSWGKEPVHYRLRCTVGERYAVYLGIISWQVTASDSVPASVRQVSILSVEGGQDVRVDSDSLKKPAIFRFDARDANQDGFIDILSSPPAEFDGAVASLSAIWVFPAGTSVDKELLRRGKVKTPALKHVSVGATAVSWYIDIAPNVITSEDWSFASASISSERTIPAGANDQFWAALPVNHRGEVFPYGKPRNWREADEGTPAYAARVQKRQTVAQFAAASPAKALDRVREYWATQLESPTRLTVPENSVMDVARTGHCYFRILRYPLSDKCAVPMGGDCLDYYDFAERDSAYEIVGLDETGRHDQAESFLNIYLARKGELDSRRWRLGQDAQGKWMTRDHEEDTQGFVLWALGEHYMLTRDKAWLERAWPWIKRGVEYIRRNRAAALAAIPDPTDLRHGLWIAGSGEMMSDEPSYWYWYNYLIECGMRYGVVAAEAMGEMDYASALRGEHEDFVACLRRSMRQRFNRLDYRRGLLPGRANGDQLLDVAFSEGCLFPSLSLEPNDPMVTLSLGYTDALAWGRGGSLPVIWYGSIGRGIWPALTGDYALMHLRRGEPEKAVDCFYSMLSTCGQINAWGEVMSWDNGISTGGQPYMWANGIFLILLRNMLLHEEGEWFAASPAGPRELWICPATPRKWLHEPSGIVVTHAPTYFGPVSFSMRLNDRGEAVATIEFEGEGPLPERLVVHARSLREHPFRRVTLNGKDHPYFIGEKVVIGSPQRKNEVICS